MLDYLGLQMAPLVQNARLRALTQRQAYRLTKLQQMGRSLDPFPGLDTVIREAVDGHVAEAIGAAGLAQDQDRKGSRKRLESLRLELLTDVAGSLRQPLTSIKGYAESLLLSNVFWPEELRREFLETIGQQADRLDQVVRDLLVPARWESGAILLDPVVFTVKGLLDQVAVELEKEPRGRPVRFRCDPTLSPVLVDSQRMVQVILWLLQAADERLGPDKTIRVEGDRNDGLTLVSVGACVEGGPVYNRDLVSASSGRGGGNLRDNWRENWMEDDLELVACRHILEGHGVTLQVAPSLDVGDLFRFTLPPAPVPFQSAGRDR